MMKAWIFNRHEQARAAGLPPGVCLFPPVVQRYFSNISGFEPAEFVRRMLDAEAADALIVGVGAGRDAFWLNLHGHRTISIDIAVQSDIPRLALADMAALPFRDSSFDAVIVADALEHTFDDRQSLLEFRRVLRHQGVLVLDVPFGDDVGEEHVRVYSERTLRRILKSAGFEIEQQVYRGAMPILEQHLPGFHAAFHALALLASMLRGPSLYMPLLNRMVNLDWRHGSRAGLRRFSQGHGAYVRARAITDSYDYRDLNRRSYENQAHTVGRSFLARQSALDAND